MSQPTTERQYFRAILRPTKPGEPGQPVFLLARTGGRKTIRVREADKRLPGVFGAYPFHLIDPSTRKLVDRAILNALPWEGKGPDPLTGAAPPISARMPATGPGLGIEEPGR